jgi:hypothetical protein
LAWGLWLAAWFYVAWDVVDWGLIRPAGVFGIDFDKHWLAARALCLNASVYQGVDLHMGFNYPQWVAFCYFWLGFLSLSAAERAWDLFHFGALVATWAIAWRGLNPRLDPAWRLVDPRKTPVRHALAMHWGLMGAVAIAIFRPVGKGLVDGNIDSYNALMAMGMVAALMTRRDGLAGVAWILLTLCKLLPVTLAGPFVLWRRWRVLGSGGAVLAVYCVMLVATGRLGYEIFFFRHIAPEISYYWRNISQSIPRVFLMFAGREDLENDPVFYPHFMMGTLAAIAAAYGVFCFWMLWRRVAFDRVIELAMLTLPLLAPLLEYHHYVLTLPTFFLQVRRWTLGGMRTRWMVLYGLLWLDVAQSYTYLDLMSHHGRWLDFSSVYAVAALAVATAIEIVLIKKPAPARSESSFAA